MDNDVVLWIVVATALAFDFTNGFHDTANAVATSISTRAMAPRVAVTMAAVLNFVGAFISLAVAATIASGIVDADLITLEIVFAGLIGAIAWNLADVVLRAAVVQLARADRRRRGRGVRRRGERGRAGRRPDREGDRSRRWSRRCWRWSPRGIGILIIYRIVGRQRPSTVSRGFRLGQIVSGGMFSLSHGTNDAQKTMGIIALALVANGNLAPGRGSADVGDRVRGHRDRARHVRGRLADHPHDGHAGSSRWTRRRASPPRARAPR